jgi:hypothetical protein
LRSFVILFLVALYIGEIVVDALLIVFGVRCRLIRIACVLPVDELTKSSAAWDCIPGMTCA